MQAARVASGAARGLRSPRPEHTPGMRRGALAGIAAAATWAALEPPLGRLLRTPYSDVRLLGAPITKGRLWPVAGLAVHLGNGAAFGAAFERLGGRGVRQAMLAAELENLILLARVAAVDRLHRTAARAPGRRSSGAVACLRTRSRRTPSSARCSATSSRRRSDSRRVSAFASASAGAEDRLALAPVAHQLGVHEDAVEDVRAAEARRPAAHLLDEEPDDEGVELRSRAALELLLWPPLPRARPRRRR